MNDSQQLVRLAPALIKLANIGNSRKPVPYLHSGPNVLTCWHVNVSSSPARENIRMIECANPAIAVPLYIIEDVRVACKSNHVSRGVCVCACRNHEFQLGLTFICLSSDCWCWYIHHHNHHHHNESLNPAADKKSQRTR